MKALGVLLCAFALAALVPTAAGVSVPSANAHCAPPCGYIFPTIIVTSPVSGPLWLNESMEIPLSIIYEWNFDNEGTGLHDASNPVKLTFDAPKKPNWVDWTVEPTEIVLGPPEFNPVTTYHYEYAAMLTLTPDLALPIEERAGTKMLLFIQSSESGTFKKSYGVEVFKFPNFQEPLPVNSEEKKKGFSFEMEGSPAGGAGLLPLAALAALVLLVFHKKR